MPKRRYSKKREENKEGGNSPHIQKQEQTRNSKYDTKKKNTRGASRRAQEEHQKSTKKSIKKKTKHTRNRTPIRTPSKKLINLEMNLVILIFENNFFGQDSNTITKRIKNNMRNKSEV